MDLRVLLDCPTSGPFFSSTWDHDKFTLDTVTTPLILSTFHTPVELVNKMPPNAALLNSMSLTPTSRCNKIVPLAL